VGIKKQVLKDPQEVGFIRERFLDKEPFRSPLTQARLSYDVKHKDKKATGWSNTRGKTTGIAKIFKKSCAKKNIGTKNYFIIK